MKSKSCSNKPMVEKTNFKTAASVVIFQHLKRVYFHFIVHSSELGSNCTKIVLTGLSRFNTKTHLPSGAKYIDRGMAILHLFTFWRGCHSDVIVPHKLSNSCQTIAKKCHF